MNKVLVLGAGGPAGVNFIRALRRARGRQYFIVGADVDRWHLEWPDVDAAYQAPRNTAVGYKKFVLKLIEQHGIDFVHAQPDSEVAWLSTNRAAVEDAGAKVFLPSQNAIAVFQDKAASAEVWKNAGVLRAPTFPIAGMRDMEQAARALGLPMWLRATRGGGGTGSTPVPSVAAGMFWIRYWRERGCKWHWIAQQMLPGRDFAVTTLWVDGTLVAEFARQRLEYIYPHLAPSGVTGTPVHAVSVNVPLVTHTAIKAIKTVEPRPHGIYCVDLKEDGEDTPRPTEVNAGRFFTSSDIFPYIPDAYVQHGLGNKVAVQPGYDFGDHYLRHIDCPGIHRRPEELRSVPLRGGKS